MGWYQRRVHGGLKAQIEWESVSSQLKRLNYRQALGILSQLEEKGTEVKNPTGWIISQCNKVGGFMGKKEDSDKLKRTLLWHNQHGGLEEAENQSALTTLLAHCPTYPLDRH